VDVVIVQIVIYPNGLCHLWLKSPSIMSQRGKTYVMKSGSHCSENLLRYLSDNVTARETANLITEQMPDRYTYNECI